VETEMAASTSETTPTPGMELAETETDASVVAPTPKSTMSAISGVS